MAVSLLVFVMGTIWEKHPEHAKHRPGTAKPSQGFAGALLCVLSFFYSCPYCVFVLLPVSLFWAFLMRSDQTVFCPFPLRLCGTQHFEWPEAHWIIAFIYPSIISLHQFCLAIIICGSSLISFHFLFLFYEAPFSKGAPKRDSCVFEATTVWVAESNLYSKMLLFMWTFMLPE